MVSPELGAGTVCGYYRIIEQFALLAEEMIPMTMLSTVVLLLYGSYGALLDLVTEAFPYRPETSLFQIRNDKEKRHVF